MKMVRVVVCGMSACCVAQLACGQTDALTAPQSGDTRLEGRIGAAVERCLSARVYSDWAHGAMYDEAVNSFRTHADDVDKACGWQNEYWGKTMLCTAGAIAYTHDKALAARALKKVHAFVDEFQKPNGYLSTYAKEDFLGGATNGYGMWCFNIWGRKYTLWALVEMHRATGDKKCLDAARKMADHLIDQLARLDKPIYRTGSWNGISSMSILRPMNELYRLTGDKRYLAFTQQILEGLLRQNGGPGAMLANAARKEPINTWFPKPALWAKTYEMLSCLEGAIDSLRVQDNAAVRTGIGQFIGHLEQEEINPMRSAGNFDHFYNGGKTFNASTELCDVVHWIRVCRELLLLTGEAKYADYMEEAFYNAFLAGVARDGRWGAHIIRAFGSRHLWAPAQTGMIEHQCCPDNMMRTYFDMANTMSARDAKGNTIVLQYADFTSASGADRVTVRGGYPYAEGPVEVCVTRTQAGKVRFRVPQWSAASFCVNGERKAVENGWCEVDASAGVNSYELRFELSPRILDVHLYAEPRDNGKDFLNNMRLYVKRNMTMLTPEMEGLLRLDAASYVMRGPLVLAKGRLTGMSRDDTFFASTLRGQYWKAGSGLHAWKTSIERVRGSAATAGVEDLWQLTFTRGGHEKVTAFVTDFASASNVDDPANWFSLWF